MSRIRIAYNAALPPRVYPDPPPPRSPFLNGQDHAWVTGIRRALSQAEVNQPASDVRGEAWELRSAMWSSGRLIEMCTFDTCQLCGDFCGVSSALGMQTPLFPHIDWKEKKKKKSQMLTRGISNVTNFNGKWWKNTRKARLDCPLWSLWILGEFFDCIIRTVSVEKQIAISVNQTGDNAVCHK